jgi:hypothetical protein
MIRGKAASARRQTWRSEAIRSSNDARCGGSDDGFLEVIGTGLLIVQ